MRRSSSFRTLAALLAASVTALADDFPSSDCCVVPSDFETCYKANSDAFTTCSLRIPDNCPLGVQGQCLAARGNVQLAANIGFWIQICWNQVCC
jgi:hypothetical protein